MCDDKENTEGWKIYNVIFVNIYIYVSLCLFFLNLNIKNRERKGCAPKSNVPFRYHPNVSLFQYVCRFSLMHFITTEKSICSFQRIFFKNAFHQILRVASVANLSVKRARFSR